MMRNCLSISSKISLYQLLSRVRTLSINRYTSRYCSSSNGARRRLVWCGDSTTEVVYQQQIQINSHRLGKADVLITDPPYCLLERRRAKGDLRDPKPIKRKLDEDDAVPRFANLRAYRVFTQQWLSKAKDHALKPSAWLVVFTNILGKSVIREVATSLQYQFVGEYLWAKVSSHDTISVPAAAASTSTKHATSGTINKELLLRLYESALVFSPKGTLPMPPLGPSDKSIIWHVISGYHDDQSPGGNKAHAHPCHKPFAVLEPLIRQWSQPGQLILDPFAGSGAILDAALRIGDREVVGIEKLPHWANHANDLLLTHNDKQSEET